jgi:dimethylhistidine N-methyltransferase
MNSEFAIDVDKGFSDEKKYLSSKYFYDDQGSFLFQQIMELPEYYLTRAELNIFQTKSLEILKKIDSDNLDIIELGAGDGLKTIEFLRHLTGADTNLTYHPIDISQEAINQLTKKVITNLPALNIKPLVGDYFQELHDIPPSSAKKIVLFLGANIGNYRHPKAVSLLKLINDNISQGDMLLIGIDIKKSPNLIASAYNDAQGITKAFNLNLLARINTELGGDINIDNFDFYSHYNPQTGDIESYLVSLEKQEVYLKACDKTYYFAKNELIFTELSKKYDEQEIEELAAYAGFKCIAQFHDENDYFADCLFEKL